MKKIILFLSFALSTKIIAAPTITGAGSTFIAPFINTWAQIYQRQTGERLSYQAIGSGAGIQQIEDNIVDFGATEKPLSENELMQEGLIQFPVAISAIVPIVNLPHLKPGELILDSYTLAKIYSGKITEWNDKEIQKLNPKIKLNKYPITVIYRSDKSGTTFHFTHYLEKSAPQIWTSGSGMTITWPGNTSGVGGVGNVGVSNLVKRTRGAIGYVEYNYAEENKLPWTRLVNKDENVVPQLTLSELALPEKIDQEFRRSLQAAAKGVDWRSIPGMSISLIDKAGLVTWPLAAPTYILMKKQQKNYKKSKMVFSFFTFIFSAGQNTSTQQNYLNLPKITRKYIEANWE